MATATMEENRSAISSARDARDGYGALVRVPAEISQLVGRVADAAGWDLGAASSGTYGRRSYVFESRNFSVYGYMLEPQVLAVVQIRRYIQNKYGASVRKSYALAGLDGDQLFSHVLHVSPLQWPGIYGSSAGEAIAWAESKIFGVPMDRLDTVIRQGDIAIVPVRSIPGSAEHYRPDQPLQKWTIRDTHQITIDGEVYRRGDDLFARGLIEITHTRDQHHAVSYAGRCRIVAGRRGADPWWLSTGLAD